MIDMNNYQEKIEKTEKSVGYYAKQPQFGKKGPSRIRQHFSRGISYFLVIAAGLVFYFLLLRMGEIADTVKVVVKVLMPIIYGLAIAFLLNPVVMFVDHLVHPIFVQRFKNGNTSNKISRGIGIFAGILLLMFIVAGLCNMIIPELYRSIRNMVYTLPDQLNSALAWINSLNRQDSTLGKIFANLLEQGTETFQTWLKTDLLSQTNLVMANLTAGVINIVSGAFDFLIGLIVSVYVLFSKETFSSQTKRAVYAIFKSNHANMVLHITQKSNQIFGGFITGKILDSAIIGVLCFVGLSILNMPYTLLVSVIVGVTNVIPFFGPYIGAVPSAILIMLDNPMKGIYFIIFILVLQQIDGNIIGPKILGDSTGLSAFWVIFAILLGGGLFGIVGMILGVPTFAVIYYIVGMLMNHWLEKKNLPTEAEYYSQLSFVDEHGNYVHADSVQNETEHMAEADIENKTKKENKGE